MRLMLIVSLLWLVVWPVAAQEDEPALPAPLIFQSNRDGNWNLYHMATDGTVTRLTDHPASDQFPSWSRDGEWINFLSTRGDGVTMGPAQVRPDGSGARTLSVLGAVSTVVLEGRLDWDVQVAPNGEQIAFVGAGTLNLELYVRDTATEQVTQLTGHGARDWFPTWSPDGAQIAFSSDRTGDEEVYVIDASGGDPVRLTDNPTDDTRPVWSLDGTTLLLASDRDVSFAQPELALYTIDPAGGPVTRLPSDAQFAGGLARSPDGTMVTFISNHEGRWNIYLAGAACATEPPTCRDDAVRLTDNDADDLFPAWRP